MDKVGGFSRDMVTRLKYRNLLKVCLSRRKEDMTQEQVERLAKAANNLAERRELEDDIAYRAGLEPGYVAIDVPSVKLLLSEPRMAQVDVKILGDDGKTRWLKEVTPMAEALRRRQVSQEAVYVMTTSGNERRVSEIAQKILFE